VFIGTHHAANKATPKRFDDGCEKTSEVSKAATADRRTVCLAGRGGLGKCFNCRWQQCLKSAVMGHIKHPI